MESELPLSTRGIKAALSQTPHVYAHHNNNSYQINSARIMNGVLYVRRVTDFQWIIPERVVQGLPSPLLTQAQIQAITQARTAIGTIERLVPQERNHRSQQHRRALLSAYTELSWQCSPLGIGIAPFYEYDPEKLLTIAARFKDQLEQRYAHREGGHDERRK
jgi:hypothetical protein